MTGPRLICAYARKYEPQFMVDDLRTNCAGFVDGFVELDQRDRVDELWSQRSERVAELRRLATEAGADWCLIMDPDERLEDRAGPAIRSVIEEDPGWRYTFPLLELFAPDRYRTDGPWGRKSRRRLFHVREPMKARILLTHVRMYHLKQIEPANRELRARVHKQENTWDNPRLGFDYLADDGGMVLEPVEPGRGYSPPYRPYHFHVPERLLR